MFSANSCPQIFPASTSSVHTMGASSSGMVNHGQVQFNTPVSGLEMVVDPMDGTLRRTISAPVSIPQTFLDPSSLNVSSLHFFFFSLKMLEHKFSRWFDKIAKYAANSAHNMGGWVTKSLQYGVPTRKIDIIYFSANYRYINMSFVFPMACTK